MESKSIYERIQLLRQEFKTLSIKKTGRNAHQGYSYFELKDFLPQATDLLVKYHLTATMSYEDTCVSLTVYGWGDDPVMVKFAVPLVTTSIDECKSKEGRPMLKTAQVLGMDITYYRRYLYGLLVDLSESDGHDSGASDSDGF